MNTRFLPLLAAMLVLGAGCAKTPEPIVLPDQPDHESVPLGGEIEITTAQIVKEATVNEFARCTLDLSYPNFAAEQLNPVQRLQIEHEIAHFLARSLNATTEVDTPADIEPVAETYVHDCEAEINYEYEYLRDAGEELFMNLKRSLETDYMVTINSNQLLSIKLDEFAYTGGAHANQNSAFINADLSTHQLLTLDDIIDSAHLKAFTQLEKTKLLAENKDSLYPESAAEFETIIADTNWIVSDEDLKQFGKADNFSLTPTAIIIHYNAYDIAPYAAGPIDVEIPYTDIKSMLNPESPVARL
ncbi:MAG TPA: DUF3298 domain-containing protein [bacterium]|nr:DUF3298 domain-containing protein [bacterium]